MEIWRVEDENENGMYDVLWGKYTNGFQDKNYHPGPKKSESLMEQVFSKAHLRKTSSSSMSGKINPYHFGFTGKRQFLQWIYDPKWRKEMTRKGGVVKVYKIDKRLCCFDEHQAMFLKERAKFVRSFPVDYFDTQ